MPSKSAAYRYASFSLVPFLSIIYFEGETSLAHLILFCQRNFWDSPLNYFVLIKPTATATVNTINSKQAFSNATAYVITPLGLGAQIPKQTSPAKDQ